MEIWRDISGYEGLYQISSFGNIVNIRGKISKKLKLRTDRYWYMEAKLYKLWKYKIFRVNRLVWYTFKWWDINKYDPYTKTIVCHKNHIRSDNNIDNLILWTQRENISMSSKCNRLWKKYSDRNKILMVLIYKTWKYNKKEISKKFWYHSTYFGKVLSGKI